MSLRHWAALLARGVVTGDPPISVDGDGLVSIAEAGSGTRGTQSIAHFDLLDGATAGDVDDLSTMLEQLALRDSSGNFAAAILRAATAIEVGTTGTGIARLQVTAPTDEGHLQVDPATGRASIYADGAAHELATVDALAPIIWVKPEADALGSKEIPEFVFFPGLPFAIRITSIWLDAADILVGSDVAYAGFNVRDRDQSGGSTLIVSTTTQATVGIELLDWRRTELPFQTGPHYDLPADHKLTFEQLKVSSVVAPAYTLLVFYERAPS